MDVLNVSLVQFDISWESSEINLQKIEELITSSGNQSDVIILPEMFNSGFSMKPARIAVDMNHAVIHWMKRISAEFNVLLIGSLAIQENEGYFNRLLAVQPSGEIEYYNKRHLFRMAGENKVYNPGNHRVVIEYKSWRIALFICYDLRFPVWSRNRNEYDLAIYVANWPSARADIWNTLLKARAIENQCYVAAVNRVGKDNMEAYSGDSIIFDYKGGALTTLGNGVEGVITARLDKALLNAFRADFPAWLDADNFEII